MNSDAMDPATTNTDAVAPENAQNPTELTKDQKSEADQISEKQNISGK